MDGWTDRQTKKQTKINKYSLKAVQGPLDFLTIQSLKVSPGSFLFGPINQSIK